MLPYRHTHYSGRRVSRKGRLVNGGVWVVVDEAGIVEVWLAALRQPLNPKENIVRDPLVTIRLGFAPAATR